MRTVHLLAAAALAAATVGCAADTDAMPATAGSSAAGTPTAGTPTAGAAGPSPGTVGRSTSVAPPTVEAANPGGKTSPRPNGVSVTPGPTDGDRRGDLVRGARNLTGTVHRDGRWVLLDVTGVRWALLGEPARRLTTGHTVTATGTVTRPPAGCPVEKALLVSRLR